MFDTSNWKASAFNLLLDGRDGQVLFNSVTGQSLWLNQTRRAIIDDSLGDPARAPAELVEGLAALGFVVPADADEMAAEKARYRANQLDQRRLFLTIAPTMQCNMQCSYCFQQHVPRSRPMAPDIQAGVVEFARRKAEEASTMIVQWFGGEPLLAWKVVADMSARLQAICAERGIGYHAEMLTNGLLINPEIVAALPRLAVRALQLSLDGTAATYAERRRVAPARAKAYYDFLVDTMPAIVDGTGSVTLRINVDRANIDEAKEVVLMFKRAGIVDPRLDFRLGFLNTSRGIIDCIPHDCFTEPEFAEQEDEFRRFLGEEGYMVFGMPQPLNYPCTATIRNGFTIDPEGVIGKCVPAIGTPQSAFARIHPGDIDRTLAEVAGAAHPYGEFDPFASQGCSDCTLLPVCLGSCPKHHQDGRLSSCGMKAGLADKMAFYGAFHHRRTTAA